MNKPMEVTDTFLKEIDKKISDWEGKLRSAQIGIASMSYSILLDELKDLRNLYLQLKMGVR